MDVLKVEHSASIGEAFERFLDEVADWASRCLGTSRFPVPGDGHDQATFTAAWGDVVRRRSVPGLLPFLRQTRDVLAGHCTATGRWHHGYWRQQEVHHGTEHADVFLRFLWGLDPEDAATRLQVLDACEHLGRTYLALARRALRGNRHHGCGADSDGAVARGHGRENGVGVVTGVLGPLLEAFA
ncbi:MAG: hypothetical protein JXR77_08360 [Lentisphaeria bacterium]|nr:hypothetical protein [Lentisphaeria bacterium]